MPTITVQASELAYLKSYTGSNWQTGEAYQGAYGTNRKIGLMGFGGLREVDWSANRVVAARLWLKFGLAGAAASGKALGLYAATRSSRGGTGADMIGANIGVIALSSITYGRDEWISFTETENAGAYARLAAWIEAGETTALVVYMPENTGGGSYSANYLNITAATLTVDYETRGSGLAADRTQIAPGDTVRLTIEPMDGATGHALWYQAGSGDAVTIAELGGSATAYSWAVPDGLFTAMRAAHQTSQALVIGLDTLADGGTVGTRTVTAQLRVPEAARPVISAWTPRRYVSYTDDQAQTAYRDDVSGAGVWADIAVSVADAAPDCDTASVAVYRWPDGDESQRELVETVSAAADIGAYTLDRADCRLTGTAATGTAWVYELVVDNGYYSVSAQATVHKSAVPLHIAGSGYGVGIGKYSGGTQADPRFECAWPAHFDAGIANIQTGLEANATAVASGQYLDVAVAFGRAYAQAPAVVACLVADVSAGTFGRCSAVVVAGSVTASGFTVRIHNGDSSSRTPQVAWIAVGI